MTDGDVPHDHRLILERLAQQFVDELRVSAAAIGLATGGTNWLPAYATNAVAADLEQYAFTVGEGPSVDALQSHALVVVSDLDATEATMRWPAWSTAALEAGIRSVAAFPAQAGAITAGVLVAYCSAPRQLSGHDLRTGLRLAAGALLGLLDLAVGLTRDGADSDADKDELSTILRADVHLAAGMVMAQAGITIDEALARLRAHAFSTARPLAEVAADVVSRRVRFEPDSQSAK